MSEIRKHYFLEEFCIIAGERSRRPSDFISKTKESDITDCAFCGGNEDMTPAATAAYKDGQVLKDTQYERVKDWQIRCIPNLYPALSPEPVQKVREGESRWKVQNGYGFHEVIVETPEHDKILSGFTDDEMTLLMYTYRDRVSYFSSQPGIAYVSLFKNWGERAGASLNHTHSQLIAIPVLPPLIKRELDAMLHLPGCPYCDIAKEEARSPRSVARNRDWVAFTPFCSAFPFEVWVMPYMHISDLTACPEDKLESLGIILRDVLQRYSLILADPPINYMFFQGDGTYHLNLRIQPVLSTIAGFEKNTGVFINTVSPEQAAEDLRNSAGD